ncbi:hypothetical protein UPYG_G00149870 [Umbra pygmaea]|uniref:Uncharacterized protein n=1 Tax=Umbra pygmaea TaxID=75934 RepID=A0ABD0X0X4_UMBPY
MGHLKEAFFLTLDDVQERMDKLTDTTWKYLLAWQDSQLGHMATSGLDNILTRSEEALATYIYMPLPPTLRHEWERRYQQFEDEDGDEEPRLWTRFRCLLLCLSLQIYNRLLKLRHRLEWTITMLQDAADRLGLSRLLAVVGFMLQRLQQLYVSQVLRLKALRRLALEQLKAKAQVLAELRPVKQILGLPAQLQQVVADLQELGKILLQLLINSTPLYNMIQQPSDEEVENFITQQEFMSPDSHHGCANSLFLKDLDGDPCKQKPDDQPLSHRGSKKQEEQPSYVEFNTTMNHRHQNETAYSVLETLMTSLSIVETARCRITRIWNMWTSLLLAQFATPLLLRSF